MLNLDSRARRKLAFLGVLLTPVLAVQGVRVFFVSSAGPASASAATAQPSTTPALIAPTPAAPVPVKEPSTPQKAAMTYLESLVLAPDLRSPFDRPDPVSTLTIAPAAETPAPTPAAPTAEPVPRMTVSGIIASAGSGIVSINHHLYRVGDEIAKGWTVTRIDAKQRMVRITHADGRQIELTPDTPKLNDTAQP
jgi:hypothetical protein